DATPTIAGATSFKLIEGVSLFPNDSEEFSLRMWVDEATTTVQGANKTFQSKITVGSSIVTMPVNLTIKMPTTPSKSYNTNFSGATWNHKLGGIKINELNNTKQIISLTPKTESTVNLASYIMGLGESAGVYNEPSTDYRYQGEDPDNFIYFNNELWRIIGVFSDNTHGKTGEKLVKIIRNDSLGAFAWAKNNVNNWPASSLYALLNTNYYNGVDESTLTNCYQYSNTIPGVCNFKKRGITNATYRNMIENVTWHLGGISSMSNVNEVYSAERGTTVETLGYIGLMHASDYGYSVLVSNCSRTTSLGSYNNDNCGGKAWLRGDGYEWTLFPRSSNSSGVGRVSISGGVDNYHGADSGYATRPVLYLNSSVEKLSGTGSILDPYIIMN
ncbi:MAG: hypothetical protein WC177_02275, partial [Bacilli bacterium]